jgi:hypothetical protein
MIPPQTDAELADVARALGFELVCRDYDKSHFDGDWDAVPYTLLCEGEVKFDGTARECAAFLIGWRDLRSKVLGACRALDTQVMPAMASCTMCHARDTEGRRCLARAGHAGQHSALLRWEDPR